MTASAPITLSVDGQHGSIAAQAAGRREAEELLDDDDVLPEILDGRPGKNARPAIEGSRAGSIAVELLESTVVQGGIRVDMIRSESLQQPPSVVEVPVRRDILLSAAGGDGEAGNFGGDGGNGLDGKHGTAATRTADATPGANGGNGGNAGRGTDGASGGDGGDIEVRLHENNTHLLLATSCNVKGGKGGAAGRHGSPGKGGKGGKGGPGHRWNEMVGYKYYCTSACIGRNGVPGESTTLVRLKSAVDSGRTTVMSGIRAQAVAGGNLPGLIAEVAARYGAIRHQRIDPGACNCHGGQGNCIGCDSKPVHKDFQRVSGPDGENGLEGTPVVTTLRNGADGRSGSVTIAVYNDNGEENLYRSAYNLELVGFDVEDENGDGIFEPGEHLFIKRIVVRNSGGMPSPTRPIPVTAVESDWFKPVPGDEGIAYLPISIPAGHSMTVEGSIKVLIRPNIVDPRPGVQFFSREDIVINAEMPWLKRPLPHFEYTKAVDLQYPCELRNFSNLATLAQGATGKVTCEVYNRGHTPVGSGAPIPRTVEVEILIPGDYGALLYQHVVIQLDLYISDPLQTPLEEGNDEAEEILTLIHRVEITTQVSNEYNYNPRSEFLLVTNSVTSRQRSHLIEQFIREDLKMELDTWNVGLYGGLQLRPGEGQLVGETVLESYHGKTVLFLGNKFDFFTHGSHNVAELCDPRWLAEAISNGTNCLFLECSDFKTYEELLTAVAFANHHQMSTLDEVLPESQKFNDVDEMVKAIAQQKQFGHLGYTQYTIPVKKRWQQFGKANPEAEAKRILKYLQKQLPQERCLVSFRPAGADKGGGDSSSMSQIDVATDKLPEFGISERKRQNFEADYSSVVVSIGAAPHISLTAIEPIHNTFAPAQQPRPNEAPQAGGG
ncbi:hypothetical protein AOQ84DRAFT_366097, partial [Glonium stellatum]